ncbi:FMN-binding protein [Exilibacterium tricleocarpae]|uniref:FMN-binding protein n=1 Tax=Exilibacterium tricleocarpae TaxID=2591008 RepID=A0A545U9J4_9GAMM|nr:FMN-binding protein [Exilibacterium tricleocarpae]TQV86144.1 FMN-binding protein [Exilibacterium tricleocarpae]
MKIIASDKQPAWIVYRALVGVGLVCALMIVSVFLLTLSAIEKNRSEALAQAIFTVLPGANTKLAFALTGGEHFVVADANTDASDAEAVIHAGYGAHGQLIGVAIEAQGMGYQDTIRILYGYIPDRQVIAGMQVLESKETPGLGSKIETDKSFLKNFSQLDVSLTAEGSAIKNAIVAVKPGQKTEPWEIDGITGATISSKAVAGILRASTRRWIPLVQRHLQVFHAAGEAHSDS